MVSFIYKGEIDLKELCVSGVILIKMVNNEFCRSSHIIKMSYLENIRWAYQSLVVVMLSFSNNVFDNLPILLNPISKTSRIEMKSY